jgi:hypothetical protein
LDTGYNSVGWPILEKIPGLNRIPRIGGNCAQPGEVMAWLRDSVRPEQDDRALIILSHRQDYSAYDGNYVKTAQQLAAYITDRSVLWFWGHEHRLAGYTSFQKNGGIAAFGRCLGHGGMPVDRHPVVRDEECRTKLEFVDTRAYDSPEGIDVGYNGLASLRFDGESLVVRYLDLTGVDLVEEQWTTSTRQPVRVSFRSMIGAGV